MSTLDKFLPPYQAKPKQGPKVVVHDKCTKCGNPIPLTQPKYDLTIKGKTQPYCQECAKKILRPQEDQDEPCVNSLTVFRTETKWTDEEDVE